MSQFPKSLIPPGPDDFFDKIQQELGNAPGGGGDSFFEGIQNELRRPKPPSPKILKKRRVKTLEKELAVLRGTDDATNDAIKLQNEQAELAATKRETNIASDTERLARLSREAGKPVGDIDSGGIGQAISDFGSEIIPANAGGIKQAVAATTDFANTGLRVAKTIVEQGDPTQDREESLQRQIEFEKNIIKPRERDLAEIIGPPENTEQALIRGFVGETLKALPVLALAAPLQLPGRAARLVTASKFGTAYPKLAGVVGGSLALGVGVAEFGAAAGVPQAVIEESITPVLEGAAHPFKALGTIAYKFATGDIGNISIDEWVNLGFFIAGGAGGFFRAKKFARLEPPGPTGRGEPTFRPEQHAEFQQFVDATFDGRYTVEQIEQMVVRFRATNKPGKAELADAIEARLSGAAPVAPRAEPAPTGEPLQLEFHPKGAELRVGQVVNWSGRTGDFPIERFSSDGQFAFRKGSQTGIPIGELDAVPGILLRDQLPPDVQTVFDRLPDEIKNNHGIVKAIESEFDVLLEGEGARADQINAVIGIDKNASLQERQDGVLHEIIAHYAWVLDTVGSKNTSMDRQFYEQFRRAMFPDGQISREGFRVPDGVDSFARAVINWMDGKASPAVTAVFDARFKGVPDAAPTQPAPTDAATTAAADPVRPLAPDADLVPKVDPVTTRSGDTINDVMGAIGPIAAKHTSTRELSELMGFDRVASGEKLTNQLAFDKAIKSGKLQAGQVDIDAANHVKNTPTKTIDDWEEALYVMRALQLRGSIRNKQIELDRLPETNTVGRNAILGDILQLNALMKTALDVNDLAGTALSAAFRFRQAFIRLQGDRFELVKALRDSADIKGSKLDPKQTKAITDAVKQRDEIIAKLEKELAAAEKKIIDSARNQSKKGKRSAKKLDEELTTLGSSLKDMILKGCNKA